MIFAFTAALFLASGVSAQTAHAREVPVFVSGTEGYKAFRIPALLKLPSGDLLAFAEGRVKGPSDWGNIDMVMKRSTDGGNTWSPLQVVVDYDTLQVSNPGPVLDRTDPAYPGGRLFLFYNSGTVPEHQIRMGLGVKRCWYVTSADLGRTWSSPVEITDQVDLLHKPDLNPGWNHPEDWRYYANTPGHACQITDGPHAGRLFVACNHTAGPPQGKGLDGDAHGYYTDDHGKTFHLGQSIHVPGANEATALALPGGTVMINTRNSGTDRCRIVALSRDGGDTWDTTWYDRQLPDPGCEGSIVLAGTYKGRPVIAFTNEAAHKRDSLTLRVSLDEGKTWPVAHLLDHYVPGGADTTGRNYSAYSDIAWLGKRSIGVLYEKSNYTRIVFIVERWR